PFTPHLMPMTRGMLSTIYLHGESPEQWHATIAQQYEHEQFVHLLEQGELPSTASVVGSNRCDIGIVVRDQHSAVVVSCIDNLLKGAAGQAMQSANIMLGLHEQSGLSAVGVWP
ncbi:MAG: Asd/ArgC dimerization domain-containing protein, partial [Mariprofundales bacterium]|nr:Asd/ArgC dimerization domain-containing protein [Mariprofundales bacterium]